MFAWDPPIDDPEKRIPAHLDGVWKLSFVGIASVTVADSSFTGTLTNKKFDNVTNISSADINYPRNEALMVFMFSNTSRSLQSPKNSGVTNISIIAPYCDQTRPTLFTSYSGRTTLGGTVIALCRPFLVSTPVRMIWQ